MRKKKQQRKTKKTDSYCVHKWNNQLNPGFGVFLLFTSCFFAVVASVSYCLRAYSSVALPSQKAAGRIKYTNTQTYTHSLGRCFGSTASKFFGVPSQLALSWCASLSLPRERLCPLFRPRRQQTSRMGTAVVDVNEIAEHYAERRTHLRR